jgi:hypothetical protein
MFGLGVAIMVMIVGIGLLVAKDVTDLIDLACDPDNPTKGPGEAEVPLQRMR